MPIIYGTSYFRSTAAAVRYYAGYNETAADVADKIALGEIHIGTPPLRPGETFVWNAEGRAIVTEADATVSK